MSVTDESKKHESATFTNDNRSFVLDAPNEASTKIGEMLSVSPKNGRTHTRKNSIRYGFGSVVETLHLSHRNSHFRRIWDDLVTHTVQYDRKIGQK